MVDDIMCKYYLIMMMMMMMVVVVVVTDWCYGSFSGGTHQVQLGILPGWTSDQVEGQVIP